MYGPKYNSQKGATQISGLANMSNFSSQTVKRQSQEIPTNERNPKTAGKAAYRIGYWGRSLPI